MKIKTERDEEGENLRMTQRFIYLERSIVEISTSACLIMYSFIISSHATVNIKQDDCVCCCFFVCLNCDTNAGFILF